MLNERHLKALRGKFESFSDDELLGVVIDKRYSYTPEALGIADEIALQRGIEYEIPIITDRTTWKDDANAKWADRFFAIYLLVYLGWKVYFYGIVEPNTFSASSFGRTVGQLLCLFVAYQICLKAVNIWLMLGFSFSLLISISFTRYSLFPWLIVVIMLVVNFMTKRSAASTRPRNGEKMPVL